MGRIHHGRSAGNTQVSISITEELLAKIDAIAAKENRSRSNTIAHLLRQEVEAYRREHGGETLRIAEKVDAPEAPPGLPFVVIDGPGAKPSIYGPKREPEAARPLDVGRKRAKG